MADWPRNVGLFQGYTHGAGFCSGGSLLVFWGFPLCVLGVPSLAGLLKRTRRTTMGVPWCACPHSKTIRQTRKRCPYTALTFRELRVLNATWERFRGISSRRLPRTQDLLVHGGVLHLRIHLKLLQFRLRAAENFRISGNAGPHEERRASVGVQPGNWGLRGIRSL